MAIETLERTICSQSLPIIFSDFCFFQNVAAHRMNISHCKRCPQQVETMQCPLIIHILCFLTHGFALNHLEVLEFPMCFLGFLRIFGYLRFFSQYFQFFLKFYDFLRSFSNMSQGPSQFSAFVARFQHTEPRVKGWPSQAEEGRTILEVSGAH